MSLSTTHTISLDPFQKHHAVVGRELQHVEYLLSLNLHDVTGGKRAAVAAGAGADRQSHTHDIKAKRIVGCTTDPSRVVCFIWDFNEAATKCSISPFPLVVKRISS